MSEPLTQFSTLDLHPAVLKALNEIGYESPSPIQAQSIPYLLAGNDLLGQAQTGTGKTAAFALPLLSRIDWEQRSPQVLVLVPTRELAIQVAEAFQSYARHLPGLHVLPVYGGQGYDSQLRQLRRGTHIVVGTPGRVMDHLRRKSLDLSQLRTLVLDEADEMLRMGFIDDVEWILEHAPKNHQTALFSATMPKAIRKVADRYLKQPQEVKIKEKTTTAKTIRQRFWPVQGVHKLDALTRILEVESFDAMLVFVRTKTATLELAEKLSARGFSCEALNGDIQQKHRERIVERLKNARIDIIVATDVAARGLDVERISHVVNFDIPHDTESYVHRIGRTGRAGRKGEAILFVAPREKRMLGAIEKATGQAIERFEMPSVADINQRRVQRFMQRISDTITHQDLAQFHELITRYQTEYDVSAGEVAAALAYMTQGDQPLFLTEKPSQKTRYERFQRHDNPTDKKPPPRHSARPLKAHPDIVMDRYRVAVGYQHGVKPGNIVGAIANEADIENQYIGHIEIYDDFTTVDLPSGMPKDVLHILRKARVCGRKMDIQLMEAPNKGNSEKRKNEKRSKGKGKSDKARKGKLNKASNKSPSQKHRRPKKK